MHAANVTIMKKIETNWRRHGKNTGSGKKTILGPGSISCVLAMILSVSGCANRPSGYVEFYNQVAPTTYPETSKVKVFYYADVDIASMYDMFFSDMLVIGRSSFNGPFRNPLKDTGYASSLGADVLLATAQSGETRTTFIETSTPTVETTQTTGYVGGVPFSGTTTSYGTSTKTVPITVTRFDQEGYFLRNVGDVEPLWEHVRSDYARTAPSDLDGIWYSDNYELELFRSGKNIVAFINSPPSDRPDWHSGDLKFIFDAGSRTGVYLWGDRTPQPSSFGVNRFGHLEVDLKLMGQTVSFARK